MTDIYTKPSRILLRNHPAFTEKWVQRIIADDPSILGLGDLELKDQERCARSLGLSKTRNRVLYKSMG